MFGSRTTTVPAMRSWRVCRSLRANIRMKEMTAVMNRPSTILPTISRPRDRPPAGHTACVGFPTAHPEHLERGCLSPTPDDQPPNDITDEQGSDAQWDGKECWPTRLAALASSTPSGSTRPLS